MPMTHTIYTVSRRFGLLWAWSVEQGPGAPAKGLAVTKSWARFAARTHIRRALLIGRQESGDPANGDLDATQVEEESPITEKN